MADRFPLIINTSTNRIQEIPSGDNLDLDGARIVNCPGIAITDLNVTGVATIATINISNTTLTNLAISGITTIGDASSDTLNIVARVDSDIIPVTDSASDLGSTSLRWAEVWSDQVVADNIQIGVTGTNEIDTASGNLTIDSAGGTTTIDDALNVTGNSTFNGTIDVDGQAIFDDITVSAAATVTGALDVDGNATFAGTIDVDGQAIFDDITVSAASTFTGVVDINNNTTISGTLDVDSQAIFDDITVSAGATFAGAVTANSTLTVAGQTNLNGSVDLGDNTGDTITVTGRFDSALVPSTDDARDLGAASLEWRNLFIDGTANIDTLDVHVSATIASDLTVNGNTDIGNSVTDTLTINASIDSDVLPLTDDAVDLGSSTKQWRNLFIDGTANIDTLDTDVAKSNTSLELDGTLIDVFGNVGAAGSIFVSTGSAVRWVAPSVAGLQGIQGPQGTQGTQGVQGTQGTQGTQGIQGPQGTQGTQGTQGIQGRQGTQGTTGPQGLNGSNGTQGAAGPSTNIASHVTPSSNNTFDIGSSSLRWRDIYTNDLNLSNEGSQNMVDGTWGSWTIQEGEEDLYLINRRNNKYYKFVIQQVN